MKPGPYVKVTLLEKCTMQTKCAAPRIAQKLARRRRGDRGEGREEVLRAHALGMAPVPEQGQCKAAICDPHSASDSVAESDEKCPGSIL